MGVLLDIDPLTGAIETMQYDHGTGLLQITRTENVDRILDANTASYNDASQAWRGQDNDFWHVGRIPLTMLYAWFHEFNASRSPDTKVHDPFTDHPEWEKWMYAKLNSSDFRKLKTAPVNV